MQRRDRQGPGADAVRGSVAVPGCVMLASMTVLLCVGHASLAERVAELETGVARQPCAVETSMSPKELHLGDGTTDDPWA
jgi:hypothetical protein